MMPVSRIEQKSALAVNQKREDTAASFRARLRSQSVTHDSDPLTAPSRFTLDVGHDGVVSKAVSPFHAALESFVDAQDNPMTRQLKGKKAPSLTSMP